MATIIIGAITASVIFVAAFSIYSDKKKGKSACGCKCHGCANASLCGHSDQKII